MGSGRSQSKHCNVRRPLPPGGSARINDPRNGASRSLGLTRAVNLPHKTEIRLWPFIVLVEGDHAIAAVRWAAGDGARRHGCIVGDVVLGGEI
jgi:hypothetical protein